MPARKPHPTAAARISDLIAEVRRLANLSEDAVAAGQFGPAVSAAAKAAELRRDLARLKAEVEAEASTDPLDRMERMYQGAAADGSWIAAEKIAKAIDIERAKRRAVEAAASEQARRDPAEMRKLLVDALRRLPASMRGDIIREASQPEPGAAH